MSRTTEEISSLSSSSPERPLKGRGRGRGRTRRGARTRGGRRGRRAVQHEENRADQTLRVLETRQTRMREILRNVESDRLRELFLQMMQFHPSLVFDVLEPGPRQCGGYHPAPDIALPDWCVCGKCREVPTDLEKVCCERQHCISLLPDFQVLMLDEAVLALAIMYRRDILVLDNEVDLMSTNRHAAYRQFILWQHGRLGSGQRRVIPSCCVWRIRDKYPDAFGQYTGFIHSRLA